MEEMILTVCDFYHRYIDAIRTDDVWTKIIDECGYTANKYNDKDGNIDPFMRRAMIAVVEEMERRDNDAKKR